MNKTKFKLRHFIDIFLERFTVCNTTTWAASLAFYTSLSLAPLLILFVTFSSQLSPQIQQSFVTEATYLVGPQAGEMIAMVIQNSKARSDLSSISGIFGFFTLLLSASFIFGELRTALDQIFDIKRTGQARRTFFQVTRGYFKVYIMQMGLAFAFLFIMIVSLIISTALSATLYSDDTQMKVLINVLVSLFFYMGLFTLLFHYIPSEHLTWRRGWQAGLMTSFLFVSGKEAIGLYLGHSALSSTYGAAGSLVVLLAWVYYSTLILFVGAHATSTLAIMSQRAAEAAHADTFVPLKESHDV
ncbi:MAG: YihY/virulence factor BrkB family protein [Bdellovibrionaceae bacterium]|nr:YihY/virulence factor BrkB family protein [Bdellovibrio sp.]